jgi:LysM repeat protein
MGKCFAPGILMLFYSVQGFSQSGDLLIKSSEKGFYLEHKTAPKESLTSIGRLYSVHPRFLASYNSHDYNKSLAIGQVLRIPLTDSNYSRRAGKGAPVYYRITEKDNLSKISSALKTPVENLRHWNNIEGDKISAGQKLIVGFLVAGDIAKQKAIEIKSAAPAVAQKEEPKVLPEPKPVIQAGEDFPKENEPPKEEPKKNEPVFIAIKETPTDADSQEGFFKSHFYRQVKTFPQTKEELVTAGIFNTVSGWHDKKYYLLMNGAEPGTIVKIVNPANNKTIYAKVLYGMEGIRQNQGYDIRISNAAAAALDIQETDKFIVKVSY